METVLEEHKPLQRDFFDYFSAMVDAEEFIITLQNVQNERGYDSDVLKRAYNRVQYWASRLNKVQPKKSLKEVFQ